MITAQIERVTPNVASALLETNTENRSVSRVTVEKYASDMAAGNWKDTGQAIIIADDGSLNDGQHRLLALVKAGVTLNMMVVRGASRQSRDAIDTGKPRSTGDILQMFHIPNGNAVAGLASRVIAWERTGRKYAGTRSTVSKTDVVTRARNDARLLWADRVGVKHARLIKAGHASFIRYIVPDSDRATEFFDRLHDGIGLEPRNPVLTLRNWFLRSGKRIPDAQAAEAILRAWCAFRDGRELAQIKLVGELPQP